MERSTKAPYNVVATTDDDVALELPIKAVAVHSDVNNNIEDLSWSDCYFENAPDILAVFDYNEAAYHAHRSGGIAAFLGVLSSFAALFTFIFSLDPDGISLIPFFASFTIFLLCVSGIATSLLARVIPPEPKQHTAVTRTGIHHVQEASGDKQGCVLHIPFCAVKDIALSEIDASRSIIMTRISTTSTVETDFIVSGIPNVTYFRKTIFDQTAQLTMNGLSNPYRFKKFVLGKKQDALVSRAQAAVDEEGAETSLQVLQEIRDELRKHNDLVAANAGTMQL